MLAKIAPRFVISRVIQNSYFAENQAVEILKSSFGCSDEHFNIVDPQDYQTVRFYGYLSTLAKPVGFKNKYEQKAYEKACQRFKHFNETYAVYERLVEFCNEARSLYGYIERNNSSSNFFTQKIETDQDFQADVLHSIEKYNKLEDALAPYPQWQEKVKEEIGGVYHLIYNNLTESESKRKVFGKLNRQEYFL